MSNIKERIIGAVTVMSEEDALKVWQLIETTFSLANIATELPGEEESAVLQDFYNGNDEYQPYISQEDLIQKLGL